MIRAFLDIDTQIDFLFPTGALYVPGAEAILPALARLNRFAADHAIPLLSTACAHSENDPEFQHWPPHCVIDTVGQKKPIALLAGQRILEKQSTDLFDAPAAEPLLAETGAGHFIVYGVVTEVCVQAAAFGLLARGKDVTVIEDAVTALDSERAQAFWLELRARGGRVANCRAILEKS